MSRSCRSSACRLTVTFAQPASVILLVTATLLSTPGLASAGPAFSPDGLDGPDNVAALIADVAEANQRLHDLGAAVQAEKESVNKALVDVQTARDNADSAAQDVEAGQAAIKAADAAIRAAQRRVDKFAAATYINGPSDGYLIATDPADVIATATAGQALAAGSQQVLTKLHRARAEQINKESAARLAKQRADRAVTDAQASQDAAVAALVDTERKFAEQREQIDRLAAQRREAQARLEAVRRQQQAIDRPARPGDRWDTGTAGNDSPAHAAGQWDMPLPMVPAGLASGDPLTVVNTLLGVSATSAQATANMGRSFLQKVGLIKPDTPDPGITNGRIPRVYGRQASEYVIRRGLAQRGVPYSWGGGTASGPSHGIGSGAGTVGFDCSGLVLYSFAGVGIKLPHYSGSQYNLGRKIPSAQMRRGDVIFYGPGGSQHVTIYLGNGQMLEAPDVGQNVKVSPVRTSGMTPYVVRYIEY